MTFEEWREGEQWNDHCNPTDFAKAAWEYQQTIIDELQYLNNLQQDKIDELEHKLEPKLQAYVIRDDKGNIRAYTDDTGRLCIGTLEEQE